MSDIPRSDIPRIGDWSEAEMCYFFPFIKRRLGELGLLKTMHLFNEAANEIGHEVIEMREIHPPEEV